MRIHRRDESFVIEKNNMPYQVIEGMEEYIGLKEEYDRLSGTLYQEILKALIYCSKG